MLAGRHSPASPNHDQAPVPAATRMRGAVHYVDPVTDSWIASTRVLLHADGVPVVTFLLEREPVQVDELLRQGRAVQAAGYPIDIRVSALGPMRGTAEVGAEVALIVQQIGLGAAGAGLWAAVESLLRQTLVALHARQGPTETSNQQTALPRHTLTVLLASGNGPALVHSETIGSTGVEAADLGVERIVAMLSAKADPASQV
jgi:hypothetical protein